MIFSADDLRCYVIRDTLCLLEENHSRAAENLLLGTAAQESAMGMHLKARRHLGLYHITPLTHRAVWDRYLVNFPDLASKVRGLASQQTFLQDPHGELLSNLKYATAIAWMIYKRAAKPLPAADDIRGLATHWHKYFHPRPEGDIEAFIYNYRKWVSGANALAA